MFRRGCRSSERRLCIVLFEAGRSEASECSPTTLISPTVYKQSFFNSVLAASSPFSSAMAVSLVQIHLDDGSDNVFSVWGTQQALASTRVFGTSYLAPKAFTYSVQAWSH
ncbi:unnamed protein product [Protopolystoma xenopodis]|uniref:Uncharacterized protein n=1 Tax=Protopolystoma xenopodis TaxID=117903 RepID=A0A3S5BM72_9PLAT|nr:unnamed protein product [Protopolystoma xenopodis]